MSTILPASTPIPAVVGQTRASTLAVVPPDPQPTDAVQFSHQAPQGRLNLDTAGLQPQARVDNPPGEVVAFRATAAKAPEAPAILHQEEPPVHGPGAPPGQRSLKENLEAALKLLDPQATAQQQIAGMREQVAHEPIFQALNDQFRFTEADYQGATQLIADTLAQNTDALAQVGDRSLWATEALDLGSKVAGLRQQFGDQVVEQTMQILQGPVPTGDVERQRLADAATTVPNGRVQADAGNLPGLMARMQLDQATLAEALKPD